MTIGVVDVSGNTRTSPGVSRSLNDLHIRRCPAPWTVRVAFGWQLIGTAAMTGIGTIEDAAATPGPGPASAPRSSRGAGSEPEDDTGQARPDTLAHSGLQVTAFSSSAFVIDDRPVTFWRFASA